MNNTKWKVIFSYFFDLEFSEKYDPITYNTKSINGYVAGEDCTWTHINNDDYEWIEWLCITLTEVNYDLVISGLKKIHVSAEIKENKVYIYGYRNDLDYLK